MSAYYVGNGSDGALTISSTITEGGVASAISSLASSGQKNATLSSATGFSNNDWVLLIQMTGTGAGNYEFAKVASIATNTLTFYQNLANSYQNAGAQVIKVKQYSGVTVNSGGTWTTAGWNGTTGGVLAAMVSGNITVNSGGKIDASGLGFGGGAGQQFAFGGTGSGPGGGGGGDGRFSCQQGGGGGGHATSGGGGSQTGCGGGPGGSGGGTYDSATLPSGSMQLGSGGGGGAKAGVGGSNGNGGNGGGIIIFVVGGNITVGGNGISVRGSDGQTGTVGGGGGSGGAMKIICAGTFSMGTGLVIGDGGSAGGPDGGGGGAGYISNISAGTTTGTSSPTVNTSSGDTATTLDPNVANVQTSDTTNMSESVSVAFAPVTINVSDTTVMSDAVTIKIGTTTTTDFNAQLTTSNYKWLTASLLTAQQKYALRPYFKLRILDDSVQPNQMINNVGTEQPLTVGSAVTAPDGSVLAAGFDNSNHISFFKALNLHASNGGWDISTTLDTNINILGGAAQRVIISCSDWISGSYHIDIYYLNNFGNDGTNLNCVQQYSDDGGLTWNSRTIALSSTPNTQYPAKNMSLCAFKPRLVNGVLKSGFAYIIPNNQAFANGTFTSYQVMYALWNGSSWGSRNVWTQKNANSWDWTIHSLDSFYLNGRDYIVFAGFRNFIDSANVNFASGNFSLWVTSFISQNNSPSTDLMTKPIQIFSSNSVNAINQNTFTFPVATVINGLVHIVFRAVTVASVSPSAQGSTSQIVTTNVNYMITKTLDGINFTYPSMVVFSDGTTFDDSNGSHIQNYNSYVSQGQYYYLLGSGKLWEFIQNNTLADITNDVIQYSVQDSAGQPSTITLQLANQNNMWYPNGTNLGASAVSKNKKILLLQGYYNANGVPEVVPRNVYYIDDIVQNTDSKTNNLTITGRDFYKKLKTTVTKYAYGWLGPYLYADIFDGSTLANWTQVSGSWSETSNSLVNISAASDSVATLNSIPTLSYGSIMAVNIVRNLSGTQYIYGFFMDLNNWLRLEIQDGSWAIKKCINGVVTSLDGSSYGLSSGLAYTILVRRYDYYKFNFILETGAATTGNPLSTGQFAFLYASGGSGEYDLTSDMLGLVSEPVSVGVGANGVAAHFSFFKFAQYDNSNSISDLIKGLSAKAGIGNFDIQNTLQEQFNDTSGYNGTFTHPNNTIVVSAGNKTLNNTIAKKIANGEVIFKAKLTPTNSANPYGFRFIFRADNVSNEYYWHVQTTASGGYQSSRFERLYSSTIYPFPAQSSDVTSGTYSLGNGNIDLTQYHTYRIVMVDGWFFGFIDDIMVNAWNDNNTTVAYLTTGFWGWSADTNTQLTVFNMSSNAFWKQINQFSLNPGDDMENAMLSLVQTVRGWVFSNIMGFLKAIFLNTSDSSTYTYQNQIYAQGVDSSDKEYVSQVTVYGNNVSAVARNTTLMAGVNVREEVIVDYTITTQQDAQTRANYELTNANQYQSQYNPKQSMNVGAELFDPVTVVDTGNNTSGVNSTSRVYAQKFTTGGAGGGNEYSLEIDTGNL